MKTLIRAAGALFAAFVCWGSAEALPAPKLGVASTHGTLKIRYHGRHRHGSGIFKNWCAYNCYAVPPCSHGCYGHYGYSRLPYDQDLPFRYRYDWDAIPTDNGLALAYPVTGEWIMRSFERIY